VGLVVLVNPVVLEVSAVLAAQVELEAQSRQTGLPHVRRPVVALPRDQQLQTGAVIPGHHRATGIQADTVAADLAAVEEPVAAQGAAEAGEDNTGTTRHSVT
jgi:hypothetical protein